MQAKGACCDGMTRISLTQQLSFQSRIHHWCFHSLSPSLLAVELRLSKAAASTQIKKPRILPASSNNVKRTTRPPNIHHLKRRLFLGKKKTPNAQVLYRAFRGHPHTHLCKLVIVKFILTLSIVRYMRIQLHHPPFVKT